MTISWEDHWNNLDNIDNIDNTDSIDNIDSNGNISGIQYRYTSWNTSWEYH